MQLLEIPFQAPVVNIICINYVLVCHSGWEQYFHNVCIYDVHFKYLTILFVLYFTKAEGEKGFPRMGLDS